MKKALTILLLVGLVFLSGYLTCKWVYPQEPIIDYKPLDPVEGSFGKQELTPISEDLEPQIIYKWVYLDSNDKSQENLTKMPKEAIPDRGEIDTLKSLENTTRDWNIRRAYSKTLFDTPELGRIDVDAQVQYNELVGLEYNYTPVQKTIIHPPKQKVVQLFVRASYSSFDQATIGGGLYIKNVGVDAFYIRDGRQNKSGVGVGLSYRF